jgi:hypothetical protein
LDVSGISDFSTLFLLKRSAAGNPWTEIGTNAYGGSGTAVLWTGISGGFSEFGIGSEGDNSLPVELADFKADVEAGQIRLHWVTESEIENLGFLLERRQEPLQFWKPIASYKTHPELRGHGTHTGRSEYEFCDSELIRNVVYWYRLADVSFNGHQTYLDSINVQFSPNNTLIPDHYSLKEIYPNPFNPSTNIVFGLPRSTRVRIDIYDCRGRKVIALADRDFPAGWHTLLWDSRNDSGNLLSSGLYLLVIEAGDFSARSKMLLIR